MVSPRPPQSDDDGSSAGEDEDEDDATRAARAAAALAKKKPPRFQVDVWDASNPRGPRLVRRVELTRKQTPAALVGTCPRTRVVLCVWARS